MGRARGGERGRNEGEGRGEPDVGGTWAARVGCSVPGARRGLSTLGERGGFPPTNRYAGGAVSASHRGEQHDILCEGDSESQPVR